MLALGASIGSMAANAPIGELDRRPPIRWGIVLIVAGFVLQIVGAWP